MLKKQINRYIRVMLYLAAGLVILWLISRGQDIDLIWREFREANYFWIFLAALVILLSHLVRALRWNLLIESMGHPVHTGTTFNALMAGYLSNLAVPRLGELTRCLVLSKTSPTSFNALIGTVVAERVFDMLSLLLIIFLTVTLQFGFLKDFLDRVFLIPMLSQGADYWMLLLFLGIAGLVMVAGLLLFFHNKLKNPTPDGFYDKLKRQLSGIKNGIKTIGRMEKKSLFLFYSIAIWTLYFFSVYLCFFAIASTSHLSVASGITLLAVGSLGIVAPVPGGIGTYHFLTSITLTELYGIAAEPAISYAYIAHATQTAVIIAAGAIAWVFISLDRKKHKTGPIPSSG